MTLITRHSYDVKIEQQNRGKINSVTKENAPHTKVISGTVINYMFCVGGDVNNRDKKRISG